MNAAYAAKDTSHDRGPAGAAGGARAGSAAPPLWRALSYGVQPKLSVGQAGDPFEIEADHVADRVMRAEHAPISLSSAGQVHRTCATCEAGGPPCPTCEEEALVQRQHDGRAVTPAVDDDFGSGLHSGFALPGSDRQFYEARMGHDFGDVRIHTGAAADSSARQIGARAFTRGRDVAFADGQYQPASATGRHLLAHELTHVVQQRASSGAAIQRFLEPFVEPPVELPFEPLEMPEWEIPDYEELPEAPEELPDGAPEETPEEAPEESPEESPQSPEEAPDESSEESSEESNEPDTSPAPDVDPFPPIAPIPAPDEEPDESDKKCGSKDLPLTQVSYTTGSLGQGNEVTASPLTRCPGNTRGSRPAGRIYRTQFDCLRAAGQGHDWVRAHLLHGKTSRRPLFNLHGPGNQMWNLIIADKSLNGGMQAGAEDPAIREVYLQNHVLWYKSKVNSYVTNLDYFAQSITVNYGTYDTNTGAEGPSRGGGTYSLALTPPHCPAAPNPAAGGASGSPLPAAGSVSGAAPATGSSTAGTSLSFNSTLKICRAVPLVSRVFPVSSGGLQVRLGARWTNTTGTPQPAGTCPIKNYYVKLTREIDWWPDDDINTFTVPVDRTVTLRWRHLKPGNYYLTFSTGNDDPACCLMGEISTSTYDAPAPVRLKPGQTWA